ncbi:MAG: phosphoribosylformylglycinamidine cyclo-ligase [Candidatus Micrarchaeota archaeon]|nr:phosphoribosylformylglycinamidine cyclo-ligase [Candidatus Micrarchaeota archaeon]
MASTYAGSGVDLAAVKPIQDKINSVLGKTSNAFTPVALPGHYAGLFQVGAQKMTVHCDGVGSKILVAQDLNRHDTIGIDAVAMNANDIVCLGSRPIVGVDYLALSKPDEQLVDEIMKGLVAGCAEAGVALVGGETAMLPDMIKGAKKYAHADYDLAMTVVGTLDGEAVTGSKMKEGDVLLGLASSGLHSNGYTLARKTLEVEEWGEEMLTPTRLYVRPVLEMCKTGKVRGLAHITGGAFSKLSRIGKYAKVGFELTGMPKPEGIFAELQKRIGAAREIYRTFNMGVGMVVVCSPDDAQALMAIAGRHKIEVGEIGSVVRGSDVKIDVGGRMVSLL